MRLATGRVAALVTGLACALVAAGCSNKSMPGPSWNLTGHGDLARRPPEPVYAEPPRAAALPPPATAQPSATYRGGRDPVTGRAPAYHGTEPVVSQPQPRGSAPAAAPRPPSVAAANSRVRSVEVRPGQTLSMIANDNRVSIASLMAANNLRDPYLIPGQVLVIPHK